MTDAFMMMRVLPFFLLIACVAPAEAEGVFGVTQHTQLRVLPTCKSMLDPSWYYCRTLPVPDERFAFYRLQYGDGIGVCAIIAVGAVTTQDDEGSAARRQFDALQRSLSPLYGTGDRYDFLFPESGLTRPGDWMKSLETSQRLFSVEWEDVKRDSVQRVELRIKGVEVGPNFRTAGDERVPLL